MRRRFAAAVCVLTLVLAGSALNACTTASSTTPQDGFTSSPDASPGAVQPGTTFTHPLAAGSQLTVTYCNHEHARISEPDVLNGLAPAAVYVHGGSWISGNLNSGGFIISTVGPDLADQGFVVASLDYHLGPRTPWPAQIEDVKCAIRWIRANARDLDVDPNEIGAWGQSAGGHLVALLGTAGPSAGWDVGAYADESSRVQAVVDMAGPSDLLTLGDQGDSMLVKKNFISLLRKVSQQELGAALWAASPVAYAAPGDPPFLVLHADNDRIVYPQQSRELAWVLAANHVPNRLIVLDGVGHEFDQPGGSPAPANIARVIVDFFIQTLVLHRGLDAQG
jgi:acetyl esterase/lipase